MIVTVVSFPVSNVLLKSKPSNAALLDTTIVAGVGATASLPVMLVLSMLFRISLMRFECDTATFLVMMFSNALYRVSSFFALQSFDAVYHSQLRLGKRVFSVLFSSILLGDLSLGERPWTLLIGALCLAIGLMIPLLTNTLQHRKTVVGLDASWYFKHLSMEILCRNHFVQLMLMHLFIFGCVLQMHFSVIVEGSSSFTTPFLSATVYESCRSLVQGLNTTSLHDLTEGFGKSSTLQLLLINYTAKKGWHFGQHGASYVQERMLMDMFGPDTRIVRWWQKPTHELELIMDHTDLVVANAEGTLHDNCALWADMLKLVIRKKLRLWVINGSFPFQPRQSR